MAVHDIGVTASVIASGIGIGITSPLALLVCRFLTCPIVMKYHWIERLMVCYQGKAPVANLEGDKSMTNMVFIICLTVSDDIQTTKMRLWPTSITCITFNRFYKCQIIFYPCAVGFLTTCFQLRMLLTTKSPTSAQHKTCQTRS